MLGGSGGKYWGAARTPLPPPPLSLSLSLSLKNVHWSLCLCSTVQVFRGVTSYFTDACSGSRLRMTPCSHTWRHNVLTYVNLVAERT